jgi:hypothetical protein
VKNNIVDAINILHSKPSEQHSSLPPTTSGNLSGGRTIQYPSAVRTAAGQIVHLIDGFVGTAYSTA